MKSILKFAGVILLGLLMSLNCLAQAENIKNFGDYRIHYNIFNTSFLSPEIAEHYKIVRSASKAMLNISIQKKLKDGSYKPMTAIVSGNQFDLIHRDPLDFFEVVEQDATYYLSVFEIQHKIPIYFTVYVQLSPEEEPIKLEFSKMLYVDGRD